MKKALMRYRVIEGLIYLARTCNTSYDIRVRESRTTLKTRHPLISIEEFHETINTINDLEL